MKTLLLIIDMQNDFCMPAGALYIPGAEKDTARLTAFIAKEMQKINHIILTQDNHQVLDIAHPAFWRNDEGVMPPAFTNISFNDVQNNIWQPVFHPEQVKDYLRKLEEQGEYIHTIWPEHCLMGSTGAAIVPQLLNQITSWARVGNYYDIVIKGTHPLTEHFGAFRANVPIEDAPETRLNTTLIRKLHEFDNILIAGEAKSHCVANTIKQLFDFPALVKKMIILNDCMSNVPNCKLLAKSIYDKALEIGATITNTTNITL